MSYQVELDEEVGDVVDDSEIILEPLVDEGLCDTVLVPVAVHCISKEKKLKDTLVFLFHEVGYEDGVKEFLNNKLAASKYYFFTLGSPVNNDLEPYLKLFFNQFIKNVVLIRSRPETYEIAKDHEYRYFLKNIMEFFSVFSHDWLFGLKFSTIFTQEYNDSLCILNEERHNFSYPKLVKVNSAKG